MITAYKGLNFHSAKLPEVTYKVIATGPNHADISMIIGGELIETTIDKSVINDALADGTYIDGKGTDRMMIKIKTGYKYGITGNNSISRAYQSKLDSASGEWLEVDDRYLHNNQYSTICGLHVMDMNITEVKNDKRVGPKWEGKNKPFFQLLGGTLPPAPCFWLDLLSEGGKGKFSQTLWDHDNKHFPDNFHIGAGCDYYTYTNSRKTLVKFVYRNGTFYDVQSGGFLKGVSPKPMKALIKFFGTYF